MKIIFINTAGNGDVHYTREFVKDITAKIPNNEFFYCLNKDEKIIKDLQLNQPVEKMSIVSNIFYYHTIGVLKEGDIIYIQLWIGRENYIYHSIDHCSLKSNYAMYKDTYKKLGITIEPDINYYVPSIDYSFYNKNKIDEITNNDKKKILICNGDVRSGQVPNFSFYEIINKLTDNFKNVQFFITDKTKFDLIKDNIIYTDDIREDDFSDLNEISYLSTKCDIIVGRASGPFCFTHVKENMFNPHKTFISFCNTRSEGVFHDTTCKSVWSNNYDLNDIYNKIEKEINEKINIL